MTKTHRMSKTPEWNAWSEMRRRCRDSNHGSGAYYIACGIKVCDRWQSFENFYADMGPKPSRKHSLDRIDNDGHYEPGNCRWATSAEQTMNYGRNVMITAFGHTAPVAWFISPKLSARAYKRTLKRIFRYGWEPEDALVLTQQERAYG